MNLLKYLALAVCFILLAMGTSALWLNYGGDDGSSHSWRTPAGFPMALNNSYSFNTGFNEYTEPLVVHYINPFLEMAVVWDGGGTVTVINLINHSVMKSTSTAFIPQGQLSYLYNNESAGFVYGVFRDGSKTMFKQFVVNTTAVFEVNSLTISNPSTNYAGIGTKCSGNFCGFRNYEDSRFYVISLDNFTLYGNSSAAGVFGGSEKSIPAFTSDGLIAFYTTRTENSICKINILKGNFSSGFGTNGCTSHFGGWYNKISNPSVVSINGVDVLAYAYLDATGSLGCFQVADLNNNPASGFPSCMAIYNFNALKFEYSQPFYAKCKLMGFSTVKEGIGVLLSGDTTTAMTTYFKFYDSDGNINTILLNNDSVSSVRLHEGQDVVTADIDGDGASEIITDYSDGTGTNSNLSIFSCNIDTNPIFTKLKDLTSNSGNYSVVASDFNEWGDTVDLLIQKPGLVKEFTTTHVSNNFTCTDSDGGENWGIKGNITFTCQGIGDHFTDYCYTNPSTGETRLEEFSCGNVDQDSCLAGVIEVNCGINFTCSDGRCISAPGTNNGVPEGAAGGGTSKTTLQNPITGLVNTFGNMWNLSQLVIWLLIMFIVLMCIIFAGLALSIPVMGVLVLGGLVELMLLFIGASLGFIGAGIIIGLVIIGILVVAALGRNLVSSK